MYVKTSNAEQYLARVGSHSTKGSSKGIAPEGYESDPLSELTDKEHRGPLIAHRNYLLKENAKVVGKAKKAIGMELCLTDKAISELKAKLKSIDATTIPNLFIDICREQMTKPQFQAIMTEANNRQRKLNGIQS